MLFNYRYVAHSIEKFQLYLDHLVKEVWCKATDGFSVNLLHPELRDIVLDMYNTEDESTRGGVNDWLYGPIRDIYDIFRVKLTDIQRGQLALWYDHNNDIESLCACDPNKLPITYEQVRSINVELELALKGFFQSLFTDVIHLKAVSSRIGEISAHYNAFVIENNEGKCPYCGYSDIKGEHNTKREAYDHFLPKSIYPFNSVNFRNLAPMCHDCNSSYKLAQDPLRNLDPIRRKGRGARRKAFYSYAATASGINISVVLKTGDVTTLNPGSIDLQFDAPGRAEEVEAWKDIFGIEERYKAKLCAKNDGRAWLQRIEEYENYGLTRKEFFDLELRAAENYPYHDANFLKKPFLIACRDAKIV